MIEVSFSLEDFTTTVYGSLQGFSFEESHPAPDHLALETSDLTPDLSISTSDVALSHSVKRKWLLSRPLTSVNRSNPVLMPPPPSRLGAISAMGGSSFSYSTRPRGSAGCVPAGALTGALKRSALQHMMARQQQESFSTLQWLEQSSSNQNLLFLDL